MKAFFPILIPHIMPDLVIEVIMVISEYLRQFNPTTDVLGPHCYTYLL